MGNTTSSNNKSPSGFANVADKIKDFVDTTINHLQKPTRSSSPPLTDRAEITKKLDAIYSSSESTSSSYNKIANALFENSGILSLLLLLVLFIICTFIVLFYTNPQPKTGHSNIPTAIIVKNIFAVLGFLFLITLLCIMFLPSLRDFKTFLSQIINVMYVIFYTIGLILFFGLTPSKFLELYPNAINVISMLIGILVFYKAFQQNYVEKFNFTYERIKTLILFFCLIALFIVYYVIDLGGFITKYFGYSLLITILLSIFIFLYLIVIFTFSTGEPGANKKADNLLQNFSWFSILGSGSFIAFLIMVTISIYKTGISSKIKETQSSDSSGLFSDKVYCMAVLLTVLLTCVLWIIVLNIHNFPEIFKTTGTPSQINNFDFYRKALLVVFGLTIACTVVAWISYNIQNFSGKSSIPSIILNLLLLLIVFILVYKTVVVQLPFQNARKNAFFNTIANIVFYIPCLLISLFQNVTSLFADYPAADKSSWAFLFLILFLIIAYLTAPLLYNKIQMQGGQMLIAEPVNLNESHNLGTYQDLNNKFAYGTDAYDYHYALSCWVFIEATPPNANVNATQYASILDFGGKPNILYNTLNNTLLITMKNDVNIKATNESTINAPEKNINITKQDTENDYTILYKKDNILLQKWNNIIVNYNGGTMDIFLNGELMKSIPGVVPYYTLDSLTTGEDKGINGGICNVVYYNKPLTSINIYYLYNMIKDLSPPVVQNYYWWNVFKSSIKSSN